MGEGYQKFDYEGFAREGQKMKDADYADPEKKLEIDRITAVRDAVYARHEDEELFSAYMEFAQSLPKDARLTHYFIGSTPAGDAINFDTDTKSVAERIEEFAREHGLTKDHLN